MPFDLPVNKVKREGKFKISICQASTYQKGGVFLVGDAAHCHSPVGGRGMNLGIADAADLASRFVNDDLDNYTKVRHSIGKKLIAQTERGRKMMLSKNHWLQDFTLSIFKLASKNALLNKLFLEKVLLASNTI